MWGLHHYTTKVVGYVESEKQSESDKRKIKDKN